MRRKRRKKENHTYPKSWGFTFTLVNHVNKIEAE